MEGCPKPSISVPKNNIFHCGQGCLKPSFSIFKARTNLVVPLLLGGLLQLLKLLVALGASWGLPGLSWRFWCKMEGCAKPSIPALVRPSSPGGPLARGAFLCPALVLGAGALGGRRRGPLARTGGEPLVGPGTPWGALVGWAGVFLAGPLNWGALGRKSVKKQLSNQPAWTPCRPPGPGIQLPGAGKGARQTLNPKP